MKTQLALQNLAQNKARTCVATAGVTFAVVLIFMQLGFLGATRRTATLIYDGLDFDIVLRSPSYVHLTDARTLPRERLLQAAAIPEVEHTRPFYLSINDWQHPETGHWRGIIVMGTQPDDPVFTDEEIRRQVRGLREPRFLLMDRKSKKGFGPKNGEKFGDEDLGVVTTLGREPVEIVGHFKLGAGFAADGAVLLSDQGFSRVSYFQNIDQMTLGLITLRDDADPEVAKEKLQLAFQGLGDVTVETRAELYTNEEHHWVYETKVGTVFWSGVLVALLVGIMIVYQVLSADVTRMIGEYATLKAMGYRDGYLSKVILQQAVALAILGFAVGLGCAWLLYVYVAVNASIPMQMTRFTVVSVFVMSIFMCAMSGLAAVRKVWSADPADLF